MEIDAAAVEAEAREWAGGGLWGPGISQAKKYIQELANRATLSVEERLARLEDVQDIEDAFKLYHIFYGGHDLDATVDLFTDDAVQINGRGTFIGKESIRVSTEWLMTNQELVIHHGTNVFVTLDPEDRDCAIMTSRHIDFAIGLVGAPGLIGGTYVHRMRRVEGRWLIARQRITFNYKALQELVPRVVGSTAPTPDLPMSQRDLIEDWALHA